MSDDGSALATADRRPRIECDGVVGLVGDLGGTHSRLALVDHAGRIQSFQTYRAAESASVEQVIARYLRDAGCAHPPPTAVLAIAGAVVDGRARFSNLDWSIDAASLRRELGFAAVDLINDFAAQALAAPRLAPHDVRRLGPALGPRRPGPIAVMGAGTGFGAAVLVPAPVGDLVLATEAGHAGFAPSDEIDLILCSG